jgi:STE24 endopeptidase
VQIETPATLIATLPAFLGWLALYWSNFPADRALREQNLYYQLDADLPAHPAPGLWRYLVGQLRTQMLFTIVPVLLILAVRDIAAIGLRAAGYVPKSGSDSEDFILLLASVVVFIIAPEILRHVLHTQPLPDSPLRRRLEQMCRRIGLRYRDILLWRTENNMGNAAVMGIVPQVRYILLSDLLIESMTDEQIEAVFAHEVGHVVHRHMAWYVVLVMVVMMFIAALGAVLPNQLPAATVPKWIRENLELMLEIGSIIAFFLTFGFVSRRFERQADVYAARTMQRQSDVQTQQTPELSYEPVSYVGQYGAEVFNSALERVAIVNNMSIRPRRRHAENLWQRILEPVDRLLNLANNWLHGSVASRMDYLQHLSTDPHHTSRFDRKMRGVYLTLMIALVISATAVWMLRGKLFGG